MLRIALVGNWPPPHGGVSVHVAALAAYLAGRGADVAVLDVGEGDASAPPSAGAPAKCGAPAGHAGDGVVPARGPARYAGALARVARERRLVHVHTNGANAKSWIVALLGGRARRPGAPRGVLTIHSGAAPAWLAGGRARRRLARVACAGFGRILAVSDAIAVALASAGVPSGRVEVLPAFSPALVDARRAPPALAAFREAHAPLYAAAVAPGPTYGADLVLPALRAVRARRPRAGLVLFGPGSEAHVGEGVLALGEVPHAEALGVVAAADVFVRPTRVDGDAVSVREALALGRGVVATRAGHRPDGCLLVPCDDAAALAAAMEAAADARAAPRPDGGPASADPFERILRVYTSLSPRPRTDGGRPAVRAPSL